MKTALLLFAIVFHVTAADPPTPVGDWKGSLDTGNGQLRLALHVQRNSTGELRASLDSPDQGAKGIQSSSASFEGKTLKARFPSVDGGYEAAISDDGQTLTGTWTQGGGMLPLTVTRGTFPDTPGPVSDGSATPLLGTWEGALDAGAVRLRLRFTLRSAEKGGVTGLLDSLDQNAMDIPISNITLKGATFQFEVPGLRGSYTGTVNASREAIDGTWHQGSDLSLTWKKTK